jgi:hypothetical protein
MTEIQHRAPENIKARSASFKESLRTLKIRAVNSSGLQAQRRQAQATEKRPSTSLKTFGLACRDLIDVTPFAKDGSISQRWQLERGKDLDAFYDK